MKGNIKRIGLVLLTLLTLSLGTLVVNAETKDSDFVIENGVLKQYKGNDDTVYIPEGVTKIASDAFKNNEIYNDKRTYAFEDDNYILLTDKFCARNHILPVKLHKFFYNKEVVQMYNDARQSDVKFSLKENFLQNSPNLHGNLHIQQHRDAFSNIFSHI